MQKKGDTQTSQEDIKKKLKKSEEQKEKLSKQIEQLSLSVADMITIEDPQEVFERISKAIIEHSDFKRVLISYFKDVSPYRDIIGYYGVDKETVERLGKIEMPKNGYLDLFEKGLKVGQFTYYIPHTMKEILDDEATVFGTGPVPENENLWHPEDNLFVRMDDRNGNLIGVISVDESKSGQKPTEETVRPLEIFSRIISEIIIHKKAERKLKELEKQLFHAQKMESIGRLAGGIAHDFNNILTSIMGFSELLKRKFQDLDTLEGKASHTIFNAAQRAANLTSQLLGFARGGKYNPKPLNINKIIIEIVKISENIFEKNVKIKYELEDNIHTIEADRNQLDQVFTNMAINSKDAMPDGGELIFKTENVFIDEEYSSRFPDFKTGNYVKVSMTDSGKGMKKEVKDRIFEPFFTTKEKGTGLGLATVYGIMKNHKGHINCYSEPGEGTTFTIYFPFSKKEIVEERAEAKFIRGTETILVVDDEKDVIVLTKTLLTNLGYKVLTADDGIEALRIYSQGKDEIDLVLLDMIMPNQAGVKTFWELKKINQKVKVLLMSGFSQNGKATEILKGGAKGFIQKPFKLYELSKVLSEILNLE